jgi:hypothetical protein
VRGQPRTVKVTVLVEEAPPFAGVNDALREI